VEIRENGTPSEEDEQSEENEEAVETTTQPSKAKSVSAKDNQLPGERPKNKFAKTLKTSTTSTTTKPKSIETDISDESNSEQREEFNSEEREDFKESGEENPVTTQPLNETSEDNTQNLDNESKSEFEKAICQIPEMSEAVEHLTQWYHKRSFFNLTNSTQDLVYALNNSDSENANMLTSCPDFNRIRCVDIESKLLRARHCCQLINKLQMKGNDTIPKKCRDLSAEKCTKLRALRKCCREDQAKLKKTPEDLSPTSPVCHEFSRKEICKAAETIGFPYVPGCSGKKEQLQSK
jgi:hypothetical protein